MNFLWTIANKLYSFNSIFQSIARILELINFIVCSNSISAKAEIGKGTCFHHHGLGCVIHESAKIGENCTIFQNVTIGSKWPNGICEGKAPIIGNEVFIGAGAVILGNIYIGDKAIIGANSVVNCDVPSGQKIMGIPGRIKE